MLPDRVTGRPQALAFVALARPVNCLVTALSVAVGALTAGTALPPGRALLAALSALLVAAAGNALNDVQDLAADRINRPHRPLPSGRLGRRAALWGAAGLAAAGWALAAWVSPAHLLLACTVTGLLALYDLRLKSTVLWGNVVVGLAAACAFPYGALAAGGLGRSWIPAGFAFLFHLGREIIKDLEDQAGDRASGLVTLPLRCGERRAARLATGVYALLLVFTLLPWLAGIYGLGYLGLVVAVDLLVVYVLVRLHAGLGRLPGDLLGRLLKADMLLGLLAVVAGEARV
ncbi:MAG: geranylgeranylglycerol-phosphate geranylgeranyltransferase [Candidatus Latescibacterota bacterium]